MKKIAISFILSILLVSILACTKEKEVYSFSISNNIPVYEFKEVRVIEKPTSKEKEENIVSKYISKDGYADFVVYSYDKEGLSLEEYGQKMANEFGVFCNIMNEEDKNVAVINYFKEIDNNSYLVQAKFYDDLDKIIEIQVRFKFEKEYLDDNNYFGLIKNYYREENQTLTSYPYEKVFVTDSDYLPTITVCKFAKDYYNSQEFKELGIEGYDKYANDGWSFEDEIAYCSESHQLIRQDIMNRNNLDLVFIGYVENGMFYVRTLIDLNEDYLMICCTDEANKFQHVTTAILDSINR